MTNADIDYILGHLSLTTKSWPQMVKSYGKDWKNWPTSTEWWKALSRLDSLRTASSSFTVAVSGTAKPGSALKATVA